MSLNIDEYNKRKIYEYNNAKKEREEKKKAGIVDSIEKSEQDFLNELLEEPMSLDFFDYFSKTKNEQPFGNA